MCVGSCELGHLSIAGTVYALSVRYLNAMASLTNMHCCRPHVICSKPYVIMKLRVFGEQFRHSCVRNNPFTDFFEHAIRHSMPEHAADV